MPSQTQFARVIKQNYTNIAYQAENSGFIKVDAVSVQVVY